MWFLRAATGASYVAQVCLHGDMTMSETMYAPPEANIAVTSTDEPDFYVVAPRKFYLLSVLTLNLYFVYWFYRSWHLIKRRSGESMMPPMRGVFFIFFTHSLFTEIDLKIKSLGKSFAWHPSTIATVVVVLTIVSNVTDRLSAENIGSPLTDFVGIALVPIIPVFLLKAQEAINFACEDPAGTSNQNLTLANWVWIILGGLIWVLLLFGLYLIFAEPEFFAE